MTTNNGSDDAAQIVQKQIDDMQEELHSSIQKIMTEANTTKNIHYAKRNAVIAKSIEDGHLPRSFWADAIIAAFAAPEAAKGGDGEGLLGSYDAQLLRAHMTGFQVDYTENGVKVSLSFESNPFFEETELWAEAVQALPDKDDEDRETDECRFSGITWRPGHGPSDEADEAEGGGQKRERPAPSGTRGWSVLEAFSKMQPHPEDDEAFDAEEEEEELAEATEQWEEEMDDRRELLQMLVDGVWANPVAAIRLSKSDESVSCEPPTQRAKVE